MHTANISIFTILSVVLWVIIFIYWVIRSKDRGILNEIAGLVKLAASGLVLYIPVFFPSLILTYKPTLVIQVLGLLAVAFGFIVCVAAREYLASNWSGKVAIQENHGLVKNGPYKRIRHPIYSGVLVMMIGSSLIVGNIFDFVWVLFCFFGLFRKSRQEEELLVKEFGGAYEQYKKETKMIIPFIL